MFISPETAKLRTRGMAGFEENGRTPLTNAKILLASGTAVKAKFRPVAAI